VRSGVGPVRSGAVNSHTGGNQMVISRITKMADDLLTLSDQFDEIFPTNERRLLPVANPYDDYDEKKFRERFRLSKTVVKRLLDEVTVQLHSFIKLILFHS